MWNWEEHYHTGLKFFSICCTPSVLQERNSCLGAGKDLRGPWTAKYTRKIYLDLMLIYLHLFYFMQIMLLLMIMVAFEQKTSTYQMQSNIRLIPVQNHCVLLFYVENEIEYY